MGLLNRLHAPVAIGVFLLAASCAEVPSRQACTTNAICGAGYQCNFDTGQCEEDEKNSSATPSGDNHTSMGATMPGTGGTPTLPTSSEPSQCPEQSTVMDDAGIVWVCIEGGSFVMGNADGANDEKPTHEVKIQTFWIAQSEVTVAQYDACIRAGKCNSTPKTDGESAEWTWSQKDSDERLPVNGVSMLDAAEFCDFLGDGVRLPSEAEWEYAARNRGRSMTPWNSDSIDCTKANHLSESDGPGCGDQRARAVCSQSAGSTEQGLCDMLGNLSELTADYYHGSYDCDANRDAKNCTEGGVAPTDGSAWVTGSRTMEHVHRGGSWLSGPMVTTATVRRAVAVDKRSKNIGFRPARNSMP